MKRPASFSRRARSLSRSAFPRPPLLTGFALTAFLLLLLQACDEAADGADASNDGGAAGAESTDTQTGAGGTAGSDAVLPALSGEPCTGYTLIGGPEGDWGKDFGAFLIDMQGEVVHQWDIPGFPPKMLPGGSLIGCVGLFTRSYDCMEMRQTTWDGELEWSFGSWEETTQGPSARHHHDFQREGNSVGYYAPGQDFVEEGNTLVLAHVPASVPEIRDDPLEDDVIYEVDWSGELTGFEWHGAEHFEEFGFDERAKQDIRTRRPGNKLEWLHGNSLSRLGPNRFYEAGNETFHPRNILYSSRQANFLIIIDHESGDVVWRVGPQFEGQPEQALGQFAGQHMAHMIPRGLPGEGNILVLDNGGGSGFGGSGDDPNANRNYRPYSRIVEFDPLSLTPVWEFSRPNEPDLFSTAILGSVQRLPNGNTLVSLGLHGHVVEVTPQGEFTWEYQFEGTPADKATNIWVYRALRVPPEWLPEGENEAHANYSSWADLFESP